MLRVEAIPSRAKLECIVCGRKFPEGQGIVIERAGVRLVFHSKACLAKFFRMFVERLDEHAFKLAVRELVKELEEARKAREKSKKI